MSDFSGVFEVLAADQHEAQVASRKALVLARDRLDARLGGFLGASRSQAEFDARYALIGDDFAGIVHVACDEVGHGDPWSVVKTLHEHYRTAGDDHWIEKAVKKPGDLHKKLHVPEDEDIPESKIEDAEASGSTNLKEKAQFAENVKKGAADSDDIEDKAEKVQRAEDKGHAWDADDPDSEMDNDEEDSSKSSSTRGASPLASRTADSVKDGDSYDKETVDVAGKEGDGPTGLSGPSPEIKKQRWTPQSVKSIDVPSKEHPSTQINVTEALPKENLTGPAHDIDGIDAVTTTESLPTAEGMDDGGFATGGEDKGAGTETFPNDSREADPVKSDALAA